MFHTINDAKRCAFWRLRLQLHEPGLELRGIIRFLNPAGPNTLGAELLANGLAAAAKRPSGADIRPSEAFILAKGTAHRVRLELPGFAQLDGASSGSVKSGPLRAWLDDRRVWSAESPCFLARSEHVIFTRNMVARRWLANG
jgi:hypothetical protein